MSKENSTVEKAKYALENQIGWQRYATSKMLLLFTLSGGTVISLINGITIDKIDQTLLSLTLNGQIFIGTSLLTLAISVTPHCLTLVRNIELEGGRSLISWHTIKKKKHDQLVDHAKEYSEKDFLEDILNEHFAGSKITNELHVFFGVGIVVYLVGLFIFLLPLFI